MTKNKGKYGSKETGDDALPGADLVHAGEKVGHALRPHALKLALVLGGLAAVLVGVLVWQWWEHKQEGKATAVFGEAVQIIRAPVTPATPATPEAPKPPAATPSGEPKFETNQARAEAALAVLSRLDQQYGSTKVAKNAELVKAGLLFDVGRFDEAIAAYQRAIGNADSNVTKALAYEGLGYSQEAKALAQEGAARTAGLEQALETFKQLQPDEKGYYRDHALFHQARVLALLGKKKEAIDLYKQILAKFPTTTLRSEINNRLGALEEQA